MKRERERKSGRERERERETGDMTTDLWCQEFQKKRGERERKKERDRERETAYRRVCISICTFSVTLSSLLALSSHVGLSLSLSVCVCVCTNVGMLSYVVLYSSLPPLSLSLSQTQTHTVEQSKIIAVKQLLDCSREKTQKEPHTNPNPRMRMRVWAQTRAHTMRYTLT
jgi:hypothetical protein